MTFRSTTPFPDSNSVSAPSLPINLSDSLSEVPASISGNINAFQGINNATNPSVGTESFNFSGDVSGEAVLNFTISPGASHTIPFLIIGLVSSAPATSTSGSFTIFDSDNTPLASSSKTVGSASAGYGGFGVGIADSASPNSYVLDYKFSHTGAGAGAATLTIWVAPVPPALYGALAMLCLTCGLEMRKRRLQTRH